MNDSLPSSLTEVQSVEHSKEPVTCGPATTVREAAQIMRSHRVGSIIVVNGHFHPLGILTDRDLRNRVSTGDHGLDTPIADIMSSPVVTIPPHMTVADVQITMMKHGIHHLCLTENGRTDTKVIGIISEHDLLVIQGNHPAIFIREIDRSDNVTALRKVREKAEVLLNNYLQQEVAIHYICKVMSEITDALTIRTIELSEKEMILSGHAVPTVPWCWLSLGSQGRREQLLRTDQDNALIYDDAPEEEAPAVQSYFLSLAKKITQKLNEIGFAYCPANMMASNPDWCMSLGRWKDQFSTWIYEPTPQNIMLSNIFFDYRVVYGETGLSGKLDRHISGAIEAQSLFLHLMAKAAVIKPPYLTFFRKLVLEKSSEHKGAFDIKGRAMLPLADAARVLILHAGQTGITNTLHRFGRLAELEPKNAGLYKQAADAYEILMRFRALSGLKNNDTGRYFKPSELTRMQRLQLRNSFRPIGELHELLKVRFQLSHL